MAKLNVSQLFANLGQAAVGMERGRVAGEAELRRRRLEQAKQEEVYDQQIFKSLDKFAPDTQDQVTEWLFGRAQNRAAGRSSDFGMQQQPKGLTQPTTPPFAPSPVQPAPVAPPGPSTASAAGAGQPLRPTAASPAPTAASPFALADFVDTLPAPTTPHSALAEQQEAPQFVHLKATRPTPKPTPPKRRSIEIGGFGTAFLRGATPKEAAAWQSRVTQRLRDIQGYAGEDPEMAARLGGYVQMAPMTVESDADVEAAKAFFAATNPILPGLASGAQALRERRRQGDVTAYRRRFGELRDLDPTARGAELSDLLDLEDSLRTRSPEGASPIGARLGTHRKDIARIQELQETGQDREAQVLTDRIWGRVAARLTPQMEARKEDAIHRTLKGWDIKRSVNPTAVRKAYVDAGLGYKAETMSDDELVSVGRGRAEEAYQKMLAGIGRVAGLSPASQKAYLENLSRLALFAGRPDLIPPKLERDLPPGFRERKKAADERFRYMKQRHQAGDEQRAADREYRRERGATRDAAKASGKKSSSLSKFASPQERSEYNSLNQSAWGPQKTASGAVLFNESEMTPDFLEQRRAARARQNELVAGWESRKGAAEGKKSETGGMMRDLTQGRHLPVTTPRPGGFQRGEPAPAVTRPAPKKATASTGTMSPAERTRREQAVRRRILERIQAGMK